MRKMIRMLLWVVLVVAFVNPVLATFHDRFIVFFPQVVKGPLNDYYETTLVLSNPGPDPVEVTLNSDFSVIPMILATTTLQMAPGETRQIRLTGGGFQMGWVRLEAAKTIAAAAHIRTRRSQNSSEILSEVTVLAQPAASKFVIPVFLAGAIEETLIENTGVAIGAVQRGQIQLTLRDAQGLVVGSRTLIASNTNPARDFSSHFVRFLPELFPNLPAGFTTGSLAVTHFSPGLTPRALAVTALYLRGTSIWSAVATPVDVPGNYLVKFKSTQTFQQDAQQMALQYGFTIREHLFDTIVIVTALDEVAKAIARDPRVERVTPDVVIGLG